MRPLELFSNGISELKTRLPYAAVSKFKSSKVNGQSGRALLFNSCTRHNGRVLPIFSVLLIIMTPLFLLINGGFEKGFTAELAGVLLAMVTGVGTIIFGYYFKGKYPTYYPYVFWALVEIAFAIMITGMANQTAGFIHAVAAMLILAAVPIFSPLVSLLYIGLLWAYYTVLCLINEIMVYYICSESLIAVIGLFMSFTAYALYCSRQINSRKLKDDDRRIKLNSVIDTRTDLYTREYGIEQVSAELAKGTALAMVLIGVDSFGEFNRANGSKKGDEVLNDICRCIKIVVKPKTELTCRMGGDTVMVCMPAEADRDAVLVAEEIRSSIRTMNIEFNGSKFGVITVSVGAARSISGDSFDSLYSRAERSFTAAKKYGGNCIGYKERTFRSETDV